MGLIPKTRPVGQVVLVVKDIPLEGRRVVPPGTRVTIANAVIDSTGHVKYMFRFPDMYGEQGEYWTKPEYIRSI